MDDKKIENVRKIMPESIAAIGYGSGIFRQKGYNKNENPDKDIILIVDDFMEFLKEDYRMNPKHFSSDFNKTKLELKTSKHDFYSNLGCLKFYHENIHFKMMIISEKALIYDLKTWAYFGMAGRLTKPILYDNIPEELDELIKENRKAILLTALLYNNKDIMSKEELYVTISKLTYMYDFRTILPGEKKTKYSDIVSGAIKEFDDAYLDSPLLTTKKGMIKNNHPVELIDSLPISLLNYINEKIHSKNSEEITKVKLEKISHVIEDYFKYTNFINSIRLAASCSSTLGTKESINHALHKFQKHLKK